MILSSHFAPLRLAALTTVVVCAANVQAAYQYSVTSSSYGPVANTTITLSAQLCDSITGVASRTSGISVTWSKATGSGGSFPGGTSSTTNNFGIATITFTVGNSGNVYTITASDVTNPATGTSSNITAGSLGSASNYIITSSKYLLKAGNSVTVTAQLTDANFNPITTSGVSVTWGGAGSGSFFSNPTTTANGVATTTFFTSGTKATYRITASGGGASGTSPAISTANTGFTQANSDGQGGLLEPLPYVDFTEIAGLVTSAIPNDFGETCASCHDGSDSTIPDYSSATNTYNTLVNVTSTHDPITTQDQQNGYPAGSPDASPELRVNPSNASASILFFKLNNTNAPGGQMPLFGPSYLTTDKMQLVRDWINQGAYNLPSKYKVTSSSSSPVAGNAITLSAQLQDTNGNNLSLPGRTVNWTLAQGSGGNFASASTLTDSNGIASVSFTTTIVANVAYKFTATDTDSPTKTGTSGTVTTKAGAAAKYVVTSSNNSPTVGTAVTITAKLADANGNLLTSGGGASVNWTQSGISGSFTSGSSSTVTLGVATLTYTCGTTVGSSTVTATDATFGSFTGNVTLALQAGAANKYLVTSTNNSPTVGTAVTITAKLADQYGNLLTAGSGPSVNWTQSGISGSFTSGSSSTVTLGVATLTYTCGTTVGSTTVTATDSSHAYTGNTVLNLQVGAAAKYVVTSSSYSPVAGNTVTITAQLADTYGNSVSTAGKVVTWSNNATGGNFGTPTSTTIANGQATVNFTTSAVAGHVHTVSGTDGGGLTGTTPNITTIAGAGTAYIVTALTNSPAAGSATDTITAQLVDVNNNAVSLSNVTVNWTLSGAGSVAPASSTTNASGQATTTLTAATVAGATCTVTAKDTPSNRTGTSPTLTVVAAAAAKYAITPASFNPTVGTGITVSAQLQDTYGNNVSTAGNVVTWTKTGAGGSFLTGTTNTNGSGLATNTFTVSTVALTVHTVTGTTAGLTGTSANITTKAGAPTQYLVTSSNNTPTVVTGVTITAKLADTYGNLLTSGGGTTITWGQSGVAGGNFSSGTSSVSSGVATVTFTCGPTVGTVTISGTDSVPFTGNVAITLQPSAATQYLVTASTYTPTTSSTITISAQLADTHGNAVSTAGKVVTWSNNLTGGTFVPTTSTTDVNGLAQTNFTVSAVVGHMHIVSGTDGTFSGTAPTITTVTGTATKYIVTAATYSPAAGSNTDVITAQLSDAGGNPVSTGGITVTWTLNGTPGGSLSPATSMTNSSGQATTTLTAFTHAGDTYTVTANDSSFTGTSPTLTVVAAAGAAYVVTPASFNPTVGTTIAVNAQLKDAYGNTVSQSGNVVAWTSSTTTTAGSFSSGGSSTTNSSGVATINFTVSTVAATIHTVTAKTGGVTGVSANITTKADVPFKYLVTSTNYTPVVNQAVTITAQLADQYSNPLTLGGGANVTWNQSVMLGGFSVNPSPVSSGAASVTFTCGTTSGPVTISGTDSISLAGNVTITIQPGPASKYLVTSSSYGPAAGTAVTISAQLADTNGNPVATSGVTVNWTSTGLGASLGSLSSMTDVNGLAQVSFTTSPKSGTIDTVTGTGGGYTGTTPNITTIVGPPTHYIVTALTTSPAAGSATDVITAQLADVQGNFALISSVQVNWTIAGPGMLSVTSSNTNGLGQATVTLTASTHAGDVCTITATDTPAGHMGDSPPITVIPGAANHYVVLAASGTPTVGAVDTVTAQLVDFHGNTIATPNNTITWSSGGTGGSFLPTTSLTDNAGLATVAFTVSTVSNTTHTVRATDQNLLTGVTGAIVTQVGPAAKYLVTSDNYMPAVAGLINLTAQLADTYGNSCTSAGGLTVTWTKSSVDGSFSPPTPIAVQANGKATVAFNCGTIAQNVTLTATDTSSPTNLTGNVIVALQPGAAFKYLFSASTTSPAAGSIVNIFAQLADQNGNAVATQGNTITWNDNGTGTGVNFSSPTSQTDAAGIAVISYVTSTTAGHTHTINGTDGGGLTGVPVSITTVAGAGVAYMVTSSSLAPVAGSPVTITAQLLDTYNNPVNSGGMTITWSKTTAGGSFSSATTLVNSSGQASVMFTTSTVVGLVKVTATDDSLPTALTGNVSLTSIAGLAAKYVVTSSNNAPVAGTAVLISAQLADSNGNAIATSGIQVTWGSTGAGGSIANPTSNTNASGIATVQFTVSTLSGTVHTVTALDGGGLAGVSGAITVATGAPTMYLVTASNFSPVVGTTIIVSAQLADIHGNPVATLGRQVSWTSTATGIFSSMVSGTNASGLATVTFTAAPTAGVTFTISGTDTNGLTGTTASITTVTGTPTAYRLSSNNNRPVAGNPVTITAQLVDVNGNPVSVSGQTVTWSNSGAGQFAAATSVTGPTGAATIVFTTDSLVGLFSVTAADGSGFTGTTSAIGTIAGPGAKYVVTASSTSIIPGQAVRINAQLVDAFGNLAGVSGNVVNWTCPTGGTFSSPSSTTDSSGLTGVAFTSDFTPNVTYVATATDNADLSGSSPVITAGVGAAGGNGQVLGAPIITSAFAADGGVGVPFNFTITAVGDQPMVFTAAPLPAGLVLSGDTIAGAPQSAGTFVVHLTATNDVGTDNEDIVLTIAAQQDLSVEKAQIKLDNSSPTKANDSLQITVSVTLASVPDYTTTTMDLYLGALALKGMKAVKGKVQFGTPAITVRAVTSGSTSLMMTVAVSKANLKALAQNGLINRDGFALPLTLPLEFVITTKTRVYDCGTTVNLLYTSKLNKSGTAKKAP